MKPSSIKELMRLPASLLNEIQGNFDGEVIAPTDGRYNDARHVWNGAVDHHPALIVRPRDAQAVSTAVGFANRNQLPLAVLGGGYDWAGRSVRSGALVIDLINLSKVEI